jgi:hypothetical protein
MQFISLQIQTKLNRVSKKNLTDQNLIDLGRFGGVASPLRTGAHGRPNLKGCQAGPAGQRHPAAETVSGYQGRPIYAGSTAPRRLLPLAWEVRA